MICIAIIAVVTCLAVVSAIKGIKEFRKPKRNMDLFSAIMATITVPFAAALMIVHLLHIL